MKTFFGSVLVGVVLTIVVMTSVHADQSVEKEAQQAAESWLSFIDSGEYQKAGMKQRRFSSKKYHCNNGRALWSPSEFHSASSNREDSRRLHTPRHCQEFRMEGMW